jgi:hypothetical protein
MRSNIPEDAILLTNYQANNGGRCSYDWYFGVLELKELITPCCYQDVVTAPDVDLHVNVSSHL